MQRSYNVDVIWCKESHVYVGTSTDVPGLTLEAESLGHLLDAAFEMIPSLIEQNVGAVDGEEVVVNVRVRQPALTGSRTRHSPGQAVAPPKHRYVFEEDLDPFYA